MENGKSLLPRALLGGAVGLAALAPLGALFTAMTLTFGGVNAAAFAASWISPVLAARLGGAAWAALAVQLLLYFALGALVGAATLPFADNGRALVRRSLLHFAATAGLFGLLAGLCGWAGDLSLLLLSLLAGAYLLIWLARWVGWYVELVQLRALLGLAGGPSPLKWRETLPWLPFALLVCLALPALLRWIDLTFLIDVPLFSGLVLPLFLLPLAGLCSGLILGRSRGFCPLYPVVCALLNLFTVLLPYNSGAGFHCLVVGGAALLGNGAGALLARRKGGRA